jgi:hypothetical protein
LDCSDRLDRVCATDRLHSRFRKSEVLDLALVNQFLHRAGHVFDWYVRINTVLIEQVDHIAPESLKRGVSNFHDVLGPTVQPNPFAGLRIKLPPEFCGNHHLPTERSESLTNKFFVRERSVNLSGIEERDPAVDGRSNQRDHLLLVCRRTVAKAHSHAAEPDRRDFQIAFSKFALLLSRFASLVESLTQGVPEDKRDLIDIRLIGPVNSAGLEKIIEEVREPDFVPKETLRKVSIISPRATMSDDALLYREPPPSLMSSVNNAVQSVIRVPQPPPSLLGSVNNAVQSVIQVPQRAPLRDWVKEEIEHAGPVGLSFVRTIATEDVVVEKLIAELQLRGVDVVYPERNNKIVILTEWDSPYARSLAISFGAKASSQSYASVLEDPSKWPKSVEWYRYLRGIDGRLPGEERANKEPEVNQKSQVTPVQPKPVEATEGVNQSDFLRRLARTLKTKDVILQRRGGGIRAIGLLGSDIYDKLMILRALRPEFPDAIFFTNNFDAHFERRADWRDLHNLVIVSPFGSTLPGKWQPNAAPFRDNIQTSMYAGTLVATGFMAAQTASLLAEPKIFEVSRRGAYDFDAPKSQTHWFLDWLKTSHRRIWLTVTVILVIGFAVWLKLAVVDADRVQHISRDRSRTKFGRALRKIADPLLCNTPLWLVFWVPAIILGVSFFAQTRGPDAEPLAFFSGISIWPTEMLRLISMVLALHFMIKASFWLKDNECEITDRFCLGELPKVRFRWRDLFKLTAIRAKLKEIWAGLQRMQKVHAAWLKPGATFSADDAWFAYLRRNQFWPRVVRIALLTFIFGFSTFFAGVFFIFTKTTAAAPVRGVPAMNFHNVVAWWVTIVITVLTFYVVDAIQLNGNFIRLFARGLTIWPPLVSQRCKRIPPLTEEQLSRYHDVLFVADRTEPVARLIWYPLIVLALIFVGRSSLFDNWTWYPAMIWRLVIIALWAVGSAAFLRRAAEQLRDVALHNLELLRASIFAADDTHKTLVEEKRRETDELIQEIRGLKKGAFAPISEQPFVRAILYNSGGLGLLAVGLRLFEGL